jgi:adenylate cyclase
MAAANFGKRDHNKTLHWANQTIALKPDYWLSYALLAASYAENGDLESARQSASTLLQIWPEASISRMRESIIIPTSFEKRFVDGLRASGI